MVTEAVVIIDEEHAMLVGLPVVSDFLAHDVRPFKLSIPAGWFDATRQWPSHKYNITMYIHNITYLRDGVNLDAGINKPAMQILKWLCDDPNKPSEVYGVVVLFNQDDDGKYVDFTLDEFTYLLAEVRHLERTKNHPPGAEYYLATIRRRGSTESNAHAPQDITTQSCSTSFFLMTTD